MHILPDSKAIFQRQKRANEQASRMWSNEGKMAGDHSARLRTNIYIQFLQISQSACTMVYI